MDFSSVQMSGINLLMQTKFEYLNNSYNLLLNLIRPILDDDKKNVYTSFIKIIISQIDIFIKVVLINDPKELYPLINENSQELVKSFTELYNSTENNFAKNHKSEENAKKTNYFPQECITEENTNKTSNFKKIFASEENIIKKKEKNNKINLDDKSEFESSKDDSSISFNSDSKKKSIKENKFINVYIKPNVIKNMNEKNLKNTACLKPKKTKFEEKKTDYDFNDNNHRIKREVTSPKNLNKKCPKTIKLNKTSKSNISVLALKTSKKNFNLAKTKNLMKNNSKILNKKSGNFKQNKNPKIVNTKTEKRINRYDKLNPSIIFKAKYKNNSSAINNKKSLSHEKSLSKYRISNNTTLTNKKIPLNKQKIQSFRDKARKININNRLYTQISSNNIKEEKRKNKYFRSKTLNNFNEINNSNSKNFHGTRYGCELARACHQIIEKYKMMEKKERSYKPVTSNSENKKRRVTLSVMTNILSLKNKFLPSLTNNIETDNKEIKGKFRSGLFLFNNIKTVENGGEKE